MQKRDKSAAAGQWGILFVALLMAGLMLALALERSYERTREIESARMLAAARVVDENLALQMASVDRLLRIACDEYLTSLSSRAYDPHLLNALAGATSGVRTVILMDTRGVVRLSSHPDLLGRNFAYRDYFKDSVRHFADQAPRLSAPFRTVNAVWTVNLTRSVVDADGRFLGVATVSIDPAAVKGILSSVIYAPGLAVSVAHADGSEFVRMPDHGLPAGRDSQIPLAVRSRHVAQRAQESVVSDRIEGSPDAQLIALHTLSRGPQQRRDDFTVIVSRSTTAIYADWWREARILLGAYLAGMLGAVVALRLFQRLQRRLAHRLEQAEQASRNGAERLRLATAAAGIGVWEYELSARTLIWDESMYSVFGIDPAGVDNLYDTWRGVILADDIATTEMAMAEAIAGIRALDIQYRIRCGELVRWIRARAQVRTDVDAGPRLIGTCEDVTARVETALSLQRHEHDLQSILDNMPARIAYWDRELNNRFANSAFKAWFARGAGDIVGRSLREVVGEERYRHFLPYIEGVLRGEAQVFQDSSRAPSESGLRETLTHYIPDLGDDGVAGFYVLISDITAVKEAESALREKEERLRAIFDILPVGIVIAGKEGRVQDCNRAAEMLLDLRPGSLLPGAAGAAEFAIYGGDGLPMALEATPQFAAATQRRPVLNAEMQIVGPRGTRWFSVSAMPLGAEPGSVVVAYVDVTERRRSESALAESESRYRALATAAPVGMLRADGAGRYTYVNDRWQQLAGISALQAEGDGWRTALHPDDRDRVVAAWTAAVHAGQAFFSEFRFRPPRGEVVWVLVRAVPEAESVEPVSGYVGTVTDITERKQAEMSLSDSQSMLSNIIDSAMDAVITADDQYRVRIFNRAAEAMFGYRAEQMIGQPLERLMPLRFRADHGRHMARFAESNSVGMRAMVGGLRGDVYALRADGSEFPIESSISNMSAGGRRVFTVVVRDLTERRRAEARLIELNESLEARVEERTQELERARDQAQAANTAKSDFLANMSHEIRTPLNTVLGMVHLALLGELNPKQRDYVEKIGLSGSHLLSLINDVLDFSKIEAGKLELDIADFDLSQALADLMHLMQDRALDKHLDLQLDVSTDVPRWVRGDALRFEQVLLNLVGNAIKFTEQGRIEVRIQRSQAWSTGLLLRVEVEDSGIGMSEDTQARIFRSFEQADSSTTRKFGGTGLGLAISKRLVELMGGQIGARSDIGHGSCFWFAIPLQRSEQQSDITPLRPETGNFYANVEQAMRVLRGKRVLVADDHPFNQQVMMDMLESIGTTVCLANNGKEAIDLLRLEPFDAVLMDVQMPEMDGYEATRRIRAEPAWAGLPILALTANASLEDREHALAAGMSDFLTKPIHPDTLYAALYHWLAGEGAVAAPAAEASSTRGFLAVPARAVDVDILRRSVGDNPVTLRKFAGRFLDSVSKGVEELAGQCASADFTAMAATGHRLKSVARTVGAFHFADICSKIESLKIDGTMEAGSALIQQLRDQLTQIERELPAQLEAMASAARSNGMASEGEGGQ